MKIIKKSKMIENQKKPWVIKIKCNGNIKTGSRGCGSIISVGEKDLKCFKREDRDSLQEYLSALCPVCGSILLKPKDVPLYVRIRWFKAHIKRNPVYDDATPYAEQT